MRKREHLVHILLIQPDFFLWTLCFRMILCKKIVRGGLWIKLLKLQLQPKKSEKKNRKGNNWDSCLCMSQTILFWIQRGCFQNNFRYFLLVCYIFNCLTSNNLITICRGILWYKNHYRNLFTDGNQKLQKKKIKISLIKISRFSTKMNVKNGKCMYGADTNGLHTK